MDIRMPIMDGLEATKKIRKFDKNVKIIALTANAFDSDRVDAMNAGCDSFLTKPLNKKELMKVLEPSE
jgi:CheY-like chemotaxis protein